jgi:hypothetical protein
MSHYIVAGFTFILLLYNISVAALRTASMFWSVCFEDVSLYLLLQPGDGSLVAEYILAAAYVPVFLWMSDAFLVSIFCNFQRDRFPLTFSNQLYRAWVIWVHRRAFILLPAAAFTASLSLSLFPITSHLD